MLDIRHSKSRNLKTNLEKTMDLKISAKYLSIYRTNRTVKKPPARKIKITNRGKVRILPILDEIIAQLHNLSQKTKQKKFIYIYYAFKKARKSFIF